MLGKHAASRHSGASQMMLLQKIGVQAGGMARDRLKNPQLRAQQELSPTTHVSHRSTLNSGSLGEDATSPHAERSGVTNSSVFVGLEREKRALVRKRPWERDLPQLSSLQHEINGILSAQNNANLHVTGTITSSSLGGVDAPFTNGRGGNESNVAYDSHNIFWGADGKRRYPLALLYHRYSFTPRLHLDFTIWGDEIDDNIFMQIARRVTADGARVSHLTLDRASVLTQDGVSGVFSQHSTNTGTTSGKGGQNSKSEYLSVTSGFPA